MTGLPRVWGATAAEVARAYPADIAVRPDPLLLTRAVSVEAPVDLIWRWLCQVTVAPYSYDLIDNRGRRSPRQLTPGADRLEVGQTIAGAFELRSVEAPHHWTVVTTPRGRRMFGSVAMTYAVEPGRIVCRIAVARRGPLDRMRGHLLAWGDLVMMRKQLHTLRDLAERDAAA